MFKLEQPPIKEYAQALIAQLKKNIVLVATLLAALVFVFLLEDVVSGQVMRIDTMAYYWFVLKLRSLWLTPIMEGFSALGNPVVVLVMAALVAMFAPGKQPGRLVFFNLAAVLLLNTLLKTLVQRPRPDGFRLVSEVGYSFPSGHSMFSMAFFGLLIWMIYAYETDVRMRKTWIATLAAIIVMVGVSRVYLGVHYMSDVLAGFSVSLMWLVLYTRIFAPVFMPKPPNLPHAKD